MLVISPTFLKSRKQVNSYFGKIATVVIVWVTVVDGTLAGAKTTGALGIRFAYTNNGHGMRLLRLVPTHKERRNITRTRALVPPISANT